jgi:5-methylcytosine-specific restriction endonuclease McrA
MAYKDPERGRAYGREWMKRNPEKAREAMRRWRERNPEIRRERDREYKRTAHERRGAEIDAIKAEWLRAHPEVRRAKDQGYRARKRAAEGSFTAKDWLALVEQHGGRCAYRGEPGPLEPDHRTPLSRGGSNYIDNILPACRRCNAEKHQMTEEEFRARLASEEGDRDWPPSGSDA